MTVEATGTKPAIRIAGVDRGMPATIIVDGRAIGAFAGESVAAALLAAGIRHLRNSPRNGVPRGAFCLMGVCQECVMIIDGARRPSCQALVRDGLVVRTAGL